MEKNEFTIKWKIENYFSCSQKHGEALYSPTVVADSLCGTKWYLSLYPRGDEVDKTKKYFSCFLFRDEDDDVSVDTIFVNFKIKILLHNGDVISTAELKFEFRTYERYGKIKMGKIERLVESMKRSNVDTLIVLCHIFQNGNFTKKESDCTVKTKIGMDRYVYAWKVSSLQLYGIITRTFTDVSPLKITLFCPMDDVLIRIELVNWDNLIRRGITCKIVLLDVCGIEHDFRHDVHLLEQDKVWEFPHFFSSSQLKEKSDVLLNDDDEFTLMCYFSWANGTDFEEIEKYTYDTTPEPHCCSTLLDDLRHMLKNEKYCDVQLQIGDKTFHAHKSVLSARSAVFAAMFEKDMVENKTGIVNISDSDAEAFAKFLEFLYNDAFENVDCEIAKKLLILGDKYQVLSLKTRSSSLLKSVMSVESVCDILRLADMVSEVILKDCATNFIVENFSKILRSKRWKEWIKDNNLLASEVLCQISDRLGN